METIQFGVHYLIDGYNGNKESLASTESVTEFLAEIPDLLAMHTLCDPVVKLVGPKNKKDSGGVSGFVMIAESHISIHTFPNRKFATIDVYTCQDSVDTEIIKNCIEKYFNFDSCDEQLIPRGTRYPAKDY